MMIKDFVARYGKNRRPGREPAGKPQKPSHRPWVSSAYRQHTNSLIDNFT
jgi:hypothetical protein